MIIVETEKGIRRNKLCPCCKGALEKGKNDIGFFKSERTKPLRVYMWRCTSCGFIANFAGGGDEE